VNGDGNHALAMDQLKERIDATAVPCSSCGAPVGKECDRPQNARYRFHATRKDAALFEFSQSLRLAHEARHAAERGW
jgi:hypothetical protein